MSCLMMCNKIKIFCMKAIKYFFVFLAFYPLTTFASRIFVRNVETGKILKELENPRNLDKVDFDGISCQFLLKSDRSIERGIACGHDKKNKYVASGLCQPDQPKNTVAILFEIISPKKSYQISFLCN